MPSRISVYKSQNRNRTASGAGTYGLFEQTITAKPVGLQVDCLGQYGYFNQWSNRPAEWAAFANQWQNVLAPT